MRLVNTDYENHQTHQKYANSGTERTEALAPDGRWIRSRLTRMLADFPGFYAEGKTHRAARILEEFILEDLSRW